jgi:hypothetical protein
MSAFQHSAVERLVSRLSALGLPAQSYTIPAYTGYSKLTDDKATEVRCVEAYLGAAQGKPGYDAYGVVQTFLPEYPNLALVLLIDRRQSDGALSPDFPTFSIEVDRKFSLGFLPIVYTAFNDLDPTGKNCGLLVQSYQSQVGLADLIQAGMYSWKLLLNFKKSGQLAQIAVDFHDPYTSALAALLLPIMSALVGDIHFIRRTETISSLKIPLRGPADSWSYIDNSSTALDQGFEIARSYLDRHYREAGLTQNTNVVISRER